MNYTKDDIEYKLKILYSKYNTSITYSMIINEPNFPTRKVLTKLFGSWQSACEEFNIPYKCKKHKYDMHDAQEELNQRNNNFVLLNFNGMRYKNLTKCKTCGYEWSVSTDSLLDNNNKSHGCPACNKKDFYNKLKLNNLIQLYKVDSNHSVFKCIKCGSEFKYRNNYASSNLFNCQFCSKVDIKRYKLIKLLDDSIQSFYILGFLFSDGHFSDTGRITLKLSKNDKDIIDKISDYLKINDNIVEEKLCYGFSCSDVYTSQVLKEIYSITSNKTYNPCKINILNNDKFIAFLIGFIDGDGYIGYRSDNKALQIVIKLHVSWKDNLEYMSKTLYQICNIKNYPNPILIKDKNNNTYTSITFGNQKVINYLKLFITSNNIFLFRKKME